MRKFMFSSIAAVLIAGPAMSATLWQAITTDTTVKDLREVRIVDQCNQSRWFRSGTGGFCLVKGDYANFHTTFDGPNRTASRVEITGLDGTAIEAALIGKYGQPDARQNVAWHEDASPGLRASVENRDVLTWMRDEVKITLARTATGYYDLAYESMVAPTGAAI